MSAAVNVAVIGAGSSVFSLSLVKDICLCSSLSGSHVSLMDTDAGRLEAVRTLAERYARETGALVRFSHTLDRTRALREADFVVNAVSAKGHRHEWAMREVVSRHGYSYDGVQLGDFYQLRFALDLARDMERLCPDAWLLQIANPVFNCCTLVSRRSGIRSCGLCHGYLGYRRIAETVGIPLEEVSWEAPGFNHDIWLARFRHLGRDAYPAIDRWIEHAAEEYWRSHRMSSTHDVDMSRGAVHQYQLYGLFPVGDTVRRLGGGATVGCTAQRGEWWLHADHRTERYWFGEPFGGPDNEVARRSLEAGLDRRVREIAEAAADNTASAARMLGTQPSEEQVVSLIESLVNDVERRYQVNVPNRGALRGIPDDVVVELSAVASRKGIKPLPQPDLPPKVMIECLLPHWLDMERNLLAFETGDWSILLWNAMDSRQTRSLEQGLAAVEDILAMPGNEEMRAHFSRRPIGWTRMRGSGAAP